MTPTKNWTKKARKLPVADGSAADDDESATPEHVGQNKGSGGAEASEKMNV